MMTIVTQDEFDKMMQAAQMNLRDGLLVQILDEKGDVLYGEEVLKEPSATVLASIVDRNLFEKNDYARDVLDHARKEWLLRKGPK